MERAGGDAGGGFWEVGRGMSLKERPAQIKLQIIDLIGCGGLQCLEFAANRVPFRDCPTCRLASSLLPPTLGYE
jgi:hypothetical protein